MRRAAFVAIVGASLLGCARAPAKIEPLPLFAASFDAAREQRRLLALVSPT